MTFEQSALGASESADLVKTLASPGFDILMRLLRSNRDFRCQKVGEIISEMSQASYSDPKAIESAIHLDAIRARELAIVVRELETLASTDRDSFVETRIIP